MGWAFYEGATRGARLHLETSQTRFIHFLNSKNTIVTHRLCVPVSSNAERNEPHQRALRASPGKKSLFIDDDDEEEEELRGHVDLHMARFKLDCIDLVISQCHLRC